jgi:hypothetical protein
MDMAELAQWQARAQVAASGEGEYEARPEWGRDGHPHCSHERCAHYDGKRCEIMGESPRGTCGPTVEAMAEMLSTTPVQKSAPSPGVDAYAVYAASYATFIGCYLPTSVDLSESLHDLAHEHATKTADAAMAAQERAEKKTTEGKG